jgi:hypothetical protein
MIKSKSVVKTTKAKLDAMKVHHHTELVCKQGDEVIKLFIKDKHFEFVPKGGDTRGGFVFCSDRSPETLRRWRLILKMMLALVDAADEEISGGRL